MIHFFEWKGNLCASTRMSCKTEQALLAYNLACKLGLTLQIMKEVEAGFTPIFEYVAPNNQIVVQYGRPRLVYLHSRNRKTGEYVSNGWYKDRAQKFDFKFSDIMSHLDKKEFEGYAVSLLNNGLWVKCKVPLVHGATSCRGHFDEANVPALRGCLQRCDG